MARCWRIIGWALVEAMFAALSVLVIPDLPQWLNKILFGCLVAGLELALCASATLLPLSIIQFVRRSGRAVRGGCTQCGYDLRASTEQCPECGASIPPRAR